MQENRSSKELMLKKIRKALLEKRDNPYPNLEDTPLYPKNDEFLEIMFAEELTAVSGNFIYCENGMDFIENMLQLAEKFNWRKIYCWEPELQNLLSEYEFPFYQTDKDFEMAEVGITLCEALIARNGSVMVSNENAAGRRLSIFPHHHIIIARTGQLVLDLKDAFKLIKNKYADQLPSMISTITGPSRTADIEKTLVLGAHGPKELFVILIDDFS
ncbi:lactate utilization protein C [Pedobacter gandavensis]|uniref:LutC/YkgG family protein n=1 Tax=Pedobacter gandavensis TaxID=2679963 RepID=UPI00292D9A6F|nr:LUD domain-containing protein [Pedobacter gandavensis]